MPVACLLGAAEWQVVNPSNTPFLDRHGRVSSVQTCHDGDPLCDADGAVDGSCTFRVAVCLDVSDAGLPACGAIGIGAYRVTSPTPSSKSAVDRANARALLDALVALGGTQGGTRNNVVSFSPVISASACSPLAAVRVPSHGTAPGTTVIHGRAEGAGSSHTTDADRLKLRCL